jgi:glycosyltransferase involved in cell wall biosynthesis
MRIGIDCRTILNPGQGEGAGVGHYTHYLVKNLIEVDKKNEYVLFFDSSVTHLERFQRENTKIRQFPFSQYRRFLPFTYSHLLISAALNRERLDLFHAPANIIPLGYTRPAVVTVHDLAIYQNPAWFPTQILSTRLLVPQSLKRAHAVIAVSESTAKDLRDLFNVPPTKLTVIHEGVDINPLPEPEPVNVVHKFNLPANYLFFVGTLEPRKNIVRLIQAYADLRSRNASVGAIPLIIAGKKGWKSDEIFETIESLKIGDSVKYIGYITKNEKLALIKGARAFVFPSEYEGFGLPVLEALALGTPVLTSNLSSLPEVTGGAAVMVDPEDTNAILKGLDRIMFDEPLRQDLRAHGLEHVKRFTWEKVALRTIALYEKVGARIRKR